MAELACVLHQPHPATGQSLGVHLDQVRATALSRSAMRVHDDAGHRRLQWGFGHQGCAAEVRAKAQGERVSEGK